MKSSEKREAGKKGKKFHTLRHQISMIFTAVLLFSIVTITVINGFFLEKYYISQKVEMLLEAEKTLSELDIESILEKETLLWQMKSAGTAPEIIFLGYYR